MRLPAVVATFLLFLHDPRDCPMRSRDYPGYPRLSNAIPGLLGGRCRAAPSSGAAAHAASPPPPPQDLPCNRILARSRGCLY
jgi:hypothetical protein